MPPICSAWPSFDVDGDGSITIDELRTMLRDVGGVFGFAEEDAESLHALLDRDESAGISWEVHLP